MILDERMESYRSFVEIGICVYIQYCTNTRLLSRFKRISKNVLTRFKLLLLLNHNNIISGLLWTNRLWYYNNSSNLKTIQHLQFALFIRIRILICLYVKCHIIVQLIRRYRCLLVLFRRETSAAQLGRTRFGKTRSNGQRTRSERTQPLVQCVAERSDPSDVHTTRRQV